jgi:hypothetical protein
VTEAELAAVEASLTPEERATLDEVADFLARHGMAFAALLFVEAMVPRGIVAGTVMVALRPLVGIIWRDPKRWAVVEKVLQERGGIEIVIRRLEARA